MGHIKTIHFPFETNGKLMVLGVPILKHFRVLTSYNKGANTRALSTHLPVTTISAPSSRALLIGPALKIHVNQLLQLCTARTAWSESDQAVRAMHSCNNRWLGPLWFNSVIKLVSVLFGKCTTLFLTNADQWKPDYHLVTNEKPRNQELFGTDQ